MKSSTKGIKGIDTKIAKIPPKRNKQNNNKGNGADSPRFSEAGSRKEFQLTQSDFNKSRYKNKGITDAFGTQQFEKYSKSDFINTKPGTQIYSKY